MDNEPPYDARDIANFILDYAEEQKTPLTVMKLLKLIYLAHAGHLETTTQPLIKNIIRAWEHGPVIPSVYDNFKMHKDRPITSRATKLNVLEGKQQIAEYHLDEKSRNAIIRAFDQFSRFTAFELSTITHQEGWAWDRVWNNNNVTPGMIISDAEILKHSTSWNGKKFH